MIFFYKSTAHLIAKRYEDLIHDINISEKKGKYLQEIDTYVFFVEILKKIISNQDCCVLDYDFSDFEKNELKIENDILETDVKASTTCRIESFEDLLEKIKSSTSKISIFTSGTTGKPKKITHTISSLTRTVKENVTLKDSVWGLAYNPTHIAGLQVFFQALYNKNTLVDFFKQPRDIVYNTIEMESVTHISATPTFYRLLLPFDRKFDNVKRITFGGERSDFKLYTKLQLLFPNAKVTNIYASTELGTLLHSSGELFTIPDQFKNDIFIKDNELVVKAEFLGKSDELLIEKGMYRTGDIVELINENPTMFKFKTRISDYVNVGGYKVNVVDVEDVLSSIEGVFMANVLVKSNSVLGNMLTASVVLDGSAPELSEKEIKSILREKIQEFKIPRVIKIVKELEFTRTGKISKK